MEIIRRVRSAVDGAKVRNEILKQYAAQVDNLDTPFDDGPWAGSSMAEDNLTLDSGMGMVSYLMAAVQGDPPALIEAVKPKDIEMAADIEAAFAAKLHQWNSKESVYDAGHNATFYPSASIRIGWKNIQSKFRSVADIDSATGLPVGDDTPEDADIIPQQPIVQRTTIANGPDVKVLDPWDIYPFPANAQNYDEAEGLAEYLNLTARDLWMGINQYEYEKDKIKDLIAAGPTTMEGTDRDKLDGVEPDAQVGTWECYLYTGAMPLIFDGSGDLETPEYLLGEDFQWICCPAHQIVFRFGPNAYPFRQYDCANVFRYPNRRDGRCVTSMVTVAQESLTALVRLTENLADMTAMPGWQAPQSMKSDLDGKRIKPGGIYFTPPNGEIKPFIYDRGGAELLFQFAQDQRQRSEKTMGMGQGVTQLSQKSNRSATEIGQLGDNSIMRRDLFLQTFLEWLDRHYTNLAILWMAHMGDDGETVIAAGKPLQVTKMADFSARFIVTAHSNSMAGNPEMRRQMYAMAQQAQMQYFGSLLQFPPERWPAIYHGARAVISACGIRDVQGWLGPEPNAGDPTAMLMQISQMLMQAAQNKTDPAMAQAAQQMLQIIQQGVIAQQSQPAAQPPPIGGGQGGAQQMNGAGGGAAGAVMPTKGAMQMVDVGPAGLAAAPLRNGVGQ